MRVKAGRGADVCAPQLPNILDARWQYCDAAQSVAYQLILKVSQ